MTHSKHALQSGHNGHFLSRKKQKPPYFLAQKQIFTSFEAQKSGQENLEFVKNLAPKEK